MEKNPIIVRRVNTVEEAEVIVAWLDDQGVKASIADPANTGVFAFGVTDIEGVAICVADEATATKAKALLEKHDAERKSRPPAGESIRIKCESCGEENTYPGEAAGTVQQCKCGAYLDLPS